MRKSDAGGHRSQGTLREAAASASSPRWRARLFLSLSLFLFLSSLLASAATLLQYRRDTLGVVAGLPDSPLDPRPNPFGVNADLDRYPDPSPPARQIRSLGAAWVRQTFSWDSIEPRPGEFQWGRWDAIVQATAAQDLELIAVLRYTPGWANAGADRNSPPADPDTFAQFASAFAARYGGEIDVYQIWDEPNLSASWGGPPNAPAYASLLQAAHAAIHAADPQAAVLLAGLAPNVETGPKNISDILYLRQIYETGAAPYFEAAAAKPYGFSQSPLDRNADPLMLNFSRFVLLRAEMEKHGDSRKLLWGTNFGWNALPSGWTGAPSIWGQVSEDEQATFTAEAYRRAIDEWPWAGPLVLDSIAANLPAGDPRLGFSLTDTSGAPRPVARAFKSVSEAFAGYALPGTHPADDPNARYTGNWGFSELGADIPEDYTLASIEIPFYGTDIALSVRRGDYRGYLYCTVDGEPANALPGDDRGTYMVLTSPELAQEVVTVPVGSGLAPGYHVLRVVPERGWAQWAIQGFTVGNRLPTSPVSWLGPLLMALAVAGLTGSVYWGRSTDWGAVGRTVRSAANRLGSTGQSIAAALVSALLYVSAWLTWGTELSHVVRRFDSTLSLLVTAATAGVFYFSPWFLLTVLSAAVLLVIFYLRLDLAFALIAFSIPFFLLPRPLFDKAFSMAEILTLLALAAWALQQLAGLRFSAERWSVQQSMLRRLTVMDWAAIALILVSVVSMLTAEVRGVAIREFRVAIFEPALLYLLLRTTRLNRDELWRVVDFFILGAVLVAAIGLFRYAFKIDLITAEGGVERLRSVYGSPNNVGLYLGRTIGILAAVVLVVHSQRRWAYLGAGLVIVPALTLTFSKGALLLGVPAALGVVLLLWGGRRAAWALGAAAAAFAALLVPLSRNPRFAGLFNLAAGTNFFRLKLWQSTLTMIRDHPIVGVGPDNFLYAYRGRYILPEAWQEPNLSHPHNAILDFASRLGLLGLGIGAALQIGFWQTALAAYRRAQSDGDLRALSIGLMASMANFLAHGVVDAAFFIVDLSFVFFLTLGLMWRVRELDLIQSLPTHLGD